MDSYSAYIAATHRREELAREAADERLARLSRRDRKVRTERPAPKHSGASRPAIA